MKALKQVDRVEPGWRVTSTRTGRRPLGLAETA
jgi:hypothetical protein